MKLQTRGPAANLLSAHQGLPRDPASPPAARFAEVKNCRTKRNSYSLPHYANILILR